jgi:hypothetical protein
MDEGGEHRCDASRRRAIRAVDFAAEQIETIVDGSASSSI